MIHVVAIITAKPGKRAEVLEFVMHNVRAVRDEDGCVEYTPMVDQDSSAAKLGEDVVLIVEKWRDEAALEAHRTAPHMRSYIAKTKDLIADRRVHVLRAALPGDCRG